MPAADNVVKVEVTGGKLLGVCSGNPMAHDDPASGKIKTFNGMLLAVIQSYDHTGKILVRITSEGIRSDLIVIKTK